VSVFAVFVIATALAIARPLAEGPAALRPVGGSGQFRFTGAGTVGEVEGTAVTTVAPAAIAAGEAVTFTLKLTWTETDQQSPCGFGSPSGSTPSQSNTASLFPLTSIRPGHGEDLSIGRVTDTAADYKGSVNGSTWKCGPPNHITRTEGYVARVSGATTSKLERGCYAAFPSAGFPVTSYLGPSATFEGTFATLSIGGVDCTGAATSGTPAFTDTFTARGQAKAHAVTVPAQRTKADIKLRWAKPGDRFTVTAVTLTPKRKTSSVATATKLKITFTSRSPTSMGLRASNLTPGKLSFKVVSTKLGSRTTVRTGVTFKP
jgi:hypothetical protein